MLQMICPLRFAMMNDRKTRKPFGRRNTILSFNTYCIHLLVEFSRIFFWSVLSELIYTELYIKVFLKPRLCKPKDMLGEMPNFIIYEQNPNMISRSTRNITFSVLFLCLRMPKAAESYTRIVKCLMRYCSHTKLMSLHL